jgi:hypothetical protein
LLRTENDSKAAVPNSFNQSESADDVAWMLSGSRSTCVDGLGFRFAGRRFLGWGETKLQQAPRALAAAHIARQLHAAP